MLSRIKNHYSYSILDNGISSFLQSYNDDSDYHHQLYYSESSSPSITNPNYLQNQRSNLHTITETKTKEQLQPQPQPQPPFIKKILVVDDDPDIALAFKMGLEDNGFEVYPYNDPLFVIKELRKLNTNTY